MNDLRLTLLQSELLWEDPAGNRDRLAEQIDAVGADSDVILLPETFTTGFTMAAVDVAEEPGGPTAQWMLELAGRHDCDISGSLIVRENDRCYNRLYWAQPDGVLHDYDKRHLFRMGGEFEKYTHGTERLVVERNGWRFCPLICYDLRFPVWSRNRGDYDVLLYVANWPASRRSAWETLLPARAVENLCYSAGVNRVGRDGNGVECGGGSMIVDYLGTKLAEADDTGQALTATLSHARLERYRDKFPAWKDADRFELSPEPPAR